MITALISTRLTPFKLGVTMLSLSRRGWIESQLQFELEAAKERLGNTNFTEQTRGLRALQGSLATLHGLRAPW